MSQSSNMLNILVALPCEGRAIIDHFKLQKHHDCHAYNLYHNEAQNIKLIVTGMGPINAAAATSFIYLHNGEQTSQAFLNLGIAGSTQHPAGTLLRANKITDFTTGKNFYPFQPKADALNSAALLTVSQVDKTLQAPLIDMEAAGVFQAATKLVDQEHIQCLKIVSDDNQQWQHINKDYVIKQVQSHITSIAAEAERMATFLPTTMQQDNATFAQIIRRWHFTTYQQHQLRELMRRWNTHGKQDLIALLEQAQSAKEVLAQLDHVLTTNEYHW